MKRLITRPSSLLLVVALAVVAAMCTVSTANAASSARAAPHEPAASTAPCSFTESIQTCASYDPSVAYYDSANNASHCTFVFDIAWGDGGSTTKTVTDPTDGHHLVATHLYAAGVYTITVTPKVTAGTCTTTNSAHTFTLVSSTSAYNCSCVTYVRDTLASQAIKLDGGPGGASGYTEQWMSKHHWRRVVPPNNGTIPDGGKPMVMVWDAYTKGATSADGHMAIVVTDWSRTHLGASGKSPWYNSQTKQWNITVLQDDWSADPINCTPAQHSFTGTNWGNLYGVNFYVPA